MTHTELESLLGAFALDAVDPSEAAEIEEHLLGCDSCRAELDAHLGAAAELAGPDIAPPPELYLAISAKLDRPAPVAPAPALPSIDARRRERPRRIPAIAAGLAAAAVVAVLAILGAEVANLSSNVRNLSNASAREGLSATVAAALAAPHQSLRLTATSGGSDAAVITLPDGEAYWVGSNLAVLGEGRTYQLWARSGTRIVSVALLGPNPRLLTAFRIEPGATALMVTAEPAGGSVRPSAPVIVSGAVTT